MIKEANLMVDNLKIAGQLYLPDFTGARPAAVILCHGVPSGAVDPTDEGYAALARSLTTAGLAALTFRFRGSGESQGDFDILGWRRDLAAAIDFMQAVSEIQPSRLALAGFSAGAALAICAAAEDQRVKAVAACASPLDFSAISEAEKPQYSVAYFRKIGIIRDSNFPSDLNGWLNGFRRINALNAVARISPRPLLLLHSEGDKVVPAGNSRRLFEKAGQPKQIKVFEGEEHRLRKHPAAVQILIEWLKTNL